MLRRHFKPAFGELPIKHLTPARVERYIQAKQKGGILPLDNGKEGKPLADKTIRNHLTVLHAICERARKHGTIKTNPVQLVEKPEAGSSPDFKPRFLSRAQMERLLAAIPEAWRIFTMVQAYAGLRLGEARALRWKDLDRANGVLHVERTASRRRTITEPKSEAGRRTIAVSEKFLARLEAHRATLSSSGPEDLIFPDPAGRLIDPDYYRERVFKKAVVDAGLPDDDPDLARLRVHDLRHSFASLMIREKPGMHIKTLQTIMGHADHNTTLKIYTHVAPDHLKEIGVLI